MITVNDFNDYYSSVGDNLANTIPTPVDSYIYSNMYHNSNSKLLSHVIPR